MADDPKKNSDSPDEAGSPVEPGESDQSVTKLERSPRSVRAGADVPAKADVAAGSDADDDAETLEPPKVAAKSTAPKPKTVEIEGEPTAAHSPVAKKRDDDKTAPGVRATDAKKAAATGAGAAAKAKRSVSRPGDGGGGKRPPNGAPTGGGGEGEGRRRRVATESGGLLLLFGAFLVVGNLALKGTTVRVDATRDERFSLSKKGTGHLLSTLNKPLHIKVYAPEGFATIDAFVRDLRDLLNEYVRLGAGKIDYEVIVPDKLEGDKKTKAEADAQDAGLHKEMLGEARGTEKGATIGEGYLGMVMTYGGEKTPIAPPELDWHNPLGLEFLISTKIRELRDKEDKINHRIGYLQGHKEHGFQELTQIFGKYFPYYKLEAVDTSKGDKEIDAGLDGLFVTQPEEEIPSKELRRIDQFLMRGKPVAVFANPLHMKENDVAMNTSFAGMGIDKLLSGYGIDFKNELLVDKSQFWTPVLQGPGGIGIQMDPYPLLFVADATRGDTTFDNKFAPFFRLQELAVPFPLELTFDKARAGGDAVTMKTVVKTSPNVVTIQGTTVSMNPSPERLWQGATGQKDQTRAKGQEALLGVDVEGPIKSAFPGGGEGVDGVPAVATGTARLFVVSSGYYFGNPFQDAGKSPFGQMMPGMDPNMGADEGLMRYAHMFDRDQRARVSGYLVAWHTCDWMTGETDLLAVGAKLLQEPELNYPKSPAPSPGMDEKPDSESFKKKKQQWVETIKSEQRTTQYTCMLGGSALMLAIWAFRSYRRNSMRESVKL